MEAVAPLLPPLPWGVGLYFCRRLEAPEEALDPGRFPPDQGWALLLRGRIALMVAVAVTVAVATGLEARVAVVAVVVAPVQVGRGRVVPGNKK